MPLYKRKISTLKKQIAKRKPIVAKRKFKRKHGPSVGANQQVIIHSMNKAVFPKSMTLHVQAETQFTFAATTAQNNYFDCKLNSVLFPWDPAYTGARTFTTAGGVIVTNAQPVAGQIPLGVTAMIKAGNNGIYRDYQIHASKYVVSMNPNATGDNLLYCIAALNPTVAAPPTTYEALMLRAFSKGRFARAVDTKAPTISYYVKMRDLFGMSALQYNVLGKECGTDGNNREVQGTYSGSYLSDPKVNYVWRCAYQTGDSAALASTIPMVVRCQVHYWVEFFHTSPETSVV